MRTQDRVEAKPEVMFGKPVIRGTRVTIEQILRELGEGATPEAVIAAHQHLTLEDVRAAQAFAADYLAGEETISGP